MCSTAAILDCKLKLSKLAVQGPTEKACELFNDTLDDAEAVKLASSGDLHIVKKFFTSPNLVARYYAAGEQA